MLLHSQLTNPEYPNLHTSLRSRTQVRNHDGPGVQPRPLDGHLHAFQFRRVGGHRVCQQVRLPPLPLRLRHAYHCAPLLRYVRVAASSMLTACDLGPPTHCGGGVGGLRGRASLTTMIIHPQPRPNDRMADNSDVGGRAGEPLDGAVHRQGAQARGRLPYHALLLLVSGFCMLVL